MSRKQIPAAEAVVVDLNTQALAQAGQAATDLVLLDQQQQARVQAVAARVGYQLDTLDPDLIQRDISANMRRSVEACLEVGRGLCVLKEAAAHGTFLARLEVLGLEPSVAQRFMQAAAKFSNAASTQHLLKAAGTQTKLFELLVLDDTQVEELALLGQTGELALDDVATMSAKELRIAVRTLRESDASKQRLLNEKNAQIDNLKAKKKFQPRPGEVARSEAERAAVAELIEATNGAEVLFARLAAVAEDLVGRDSPALRERAEQALTFMVSRMREIVVATAIEVRVDDQTLCARPEWMDAAK